MAPMTQFQTFYDWAVQSNTFVRELRQFSDEYEKALKFNGPPLSLDQHKELLGMASVYRVGNLRAMYESPGQSVDATYPTKFASSPPSPVTWLEAPSYSPANDNHICFLLVDTPTNEKEHLVFCTTILMRRGSFSIKERCYVRLDRGGLAVCPLDDSHLLTTDDEGRTGFDGETTNHFLMALYFLAFVNCRNIAIREHSPSRQVRRAAERNGGMPPVTYKTVDIFPVGETVVNRPDGDGPRRDVARHLCRGHFKRYTADRPLMGTHVGQYWWPQHARGDESAGVVFKDYRVRPSA